MKTVEELIRRVRRETRNATTGLTTAGASISDAEFVDKLNDGQELAVEIISGAYSTFFERITTYTIDTSQANYEILTLPELLLLGTRIVLVEYSYSGRDRDYVNVPPVNIRERYTGTNYLRTMMGYIQSGSTIILSEIPNNNGAKVRLTYEIAPLRLDVMKITVVAGVANSPNYAISDIGEPHEDVTTYWKPGDLVTLHNLQTDEILLEGGSIDSMDLDAGTLDLEFDSSFPDSLINGLSPSNIGVIEAERTNVPQLPDVAEKFIVAYAVKEIFGRDGSKLAASAEKKFNQISESLSRAYFLASKDWPAVPEGDS